MPNPVEQTLMLNSVIAVIVLTVIQIIIVIRSSSELLTLAVIEFINSL